MNELNNISCLFLDIGGVLLSKGWGHEFRQQAAQHFFLDRTEMEDRHKMLFVPLEEGKITLDEYLDTVIFYTPRDFTRTQFIDYIHGLSTADWNMIDFIKKIKSKYALKIIAVSNESRELNSYRINKFKLTEIFDFFVSSCYVHARKPEAAVFQLAIDGAQVPLENILYIDDSKIFVNLVKDMGVAGFQHTDFQTTVNTLADYGLEIKKEDKKNFV